MTIKEGQQGNGQEGLVADTDIVFTTNVSDVVAPQHLLTIKHIFCLEGEATFMLAGRQFHISDTDGILLMPNQKPEHVDMSCNFRMTAVFFAERVIQMMLPAPQYGTQMLLAQMQNPVLMMDAARRDLCVQVIRDIKQRFEMRDHLFYYEALKRTIQMAILDNYDIYAHRHGSGMKVQGQAIQTFHRFISMLDKGVYRNKREVAHYADTLFITPKYLSEISVKASGRPASYWIDFFTSVEIGCQLQNSERPIADIAESLNFTSLSYFSHYVKAHFGVGPQEYRKQSFTNR